MPFIAQCLFLVGFSLGMGILSLQLNRILNVVGSPSDEMMAKITSESAKSYIKNLAPKPRQDFSALFLHANPLAISLLEKMLELDPDKRITAVEALEHPYLEQVS